ncbi:hypothetical protein ACFL0P_00810 [Candidatus Omnitrophota bacterium]
MKKSVFIATVLIFLVIGISMAKDSIAKASIQKIVSITTGLRMDIGKLEISIPRTYINIKNMLVLNPENFDDRIMMDMPEIYIDYDLRAILKKQIHLNEVFINLREFTVVKNKSGETNLGYVKNMRSGKQKKASGAVDIEIDKMRLKIGKIIYKDHSSGKEPIVSEYNINLDSKYRNIKDLNEIVRIITTRALVTTAIESVTDFGKVTDMASDALKDAKGILGKTASELKNIIKFPKE